MKNNNTGFSLIELLLVLLIVGLIVGITSLAVGDRSGFERRNSLKLFGNQLNMVLSEAALSCTAWGVRFEYAPDDNTRILYHWLKLENQNWRYAQPAELEERNELPEESRIILEVENNPIDIADEFISNEVIADEESESEAANNDKNDNEEAEADKKSDKEQLLPHIVLKADGEVTSFTLRLYSQNDETDDQNGLVLSVDSLGRLTLPGNGDI